MSARPAPAASRHPSESLPAFFAELDAWAEANALPVEPLRYGGHEDQWLELRGAGPLVLALHGGFWQAPFTLAGTRALAVALAGAGFRTANVEYRRPGPGGWRELHEDVLAAADALGEPGVAVGHSAGGQLALWLAAEGRVTRAVALGGVVDLGAAEAAGLGAGAVRELLGDDDSAAAGIDPARRLPLGAPHVLVHGADDDRVPVGLARAYAGRASAAGDDCRLVVLDGCDHFDPIDPRTAAWPAVRSAVAS